MPVALRARLGFNSAFAGVLATKVANDEGKTAWFVGAMVFCGAAYVHFFRVWADYPVWYHFAYLLPIIPVTGLSHYFTRFTHNKLR